MNDMATDNAPQTMRRSIALCEPHLAFAGQKKTWKFKYTTATPLVEGAKLRFDMVSKARPIDWEIPTANLKAKRNVIYMITPSGKTLAAEEVENEETVLPSFEFTLEESVEATQTLTIVVGLPPKSKEDPMKEGNQAQQVNGRRKPFHLYVDAKGKGKYLNDPEIFTMDVRGGPLQTIRAITPSYVMKNARFDVVVRFEDEFGNLTANAPEGTLIDISYEHLRENLSWKLFIPETGYLAIPNLYFNEPGVYRLKLHNLENNQIFYSAPIKCFAQDQKSLFWGLLHGESEKYNSQDSIESCVRHFRDEQAFNFFFLSPFESEEETSNEVWKMGTQNCAQFNEDDRFVCSPGFLWEGKKGEEGLRHMIYHKDQKPLLRKKEAKNNALKKIYRSSSPKELLSIPCFTAGSSCGFDFKNYNPEFERVVEIYNAWGSSECSEKEGNIFPIQTDGKKGVKPYPKGFIRQALNSNMRFGFVAGGLDDRGSFEDFYENGQAQYSPGLTAILSKEFARDAFFDALSKRSCYATTGARMLVGIEITDATMGMELSTKTKPGLVVNRHISVFAVGTAPLRTVDIIRNGEVLHTETIDGDSVEFSYDDMTDLRKVCLAKGIGEHKFSYYYIRVTQEDGHVAWSSPIWIDLVETELMQSL